MDLLSLFISFGGRLDDCFIRLLYLFMGLFFLLSFFAYIFGFVFIIFFKGFIVYILYIVRVFVFIIFRWDLELLNGESFMCYFEIYLLVRVFYFV